MTYTHTMAHTKFVYNVREARVVDPYAVARAEAFVRARASTAMHRFFLEQMSEPRGTTLLRLWRREQREEIQRQCARKRERIIRQSRSKKSREDDIARAREAKYSYASDGYDDIVEQSGVAASVAAIVGALSAGAIALSTRKCVKVVESNMNVLSHKLGNLSDSATVTIENVGDTFAGVNGVFGGIAKAVTSFVNTVKEIGGQFWKLIVAVLAIVLKSVSGVSAFVVDAIRGMLVKAVPEVESAIEAHDLIIEQDAAGLAGRIAAAAACFVTPKGMSAMALFTCIIGKVGNFTRTATGLEGLFTLGLTLLEKALNAILGVFGRGGIKLVGYAASQVNDWCKEVDAIFCKIDTSDPTIADLTRAKALMVTGYNLKATLQAPYLKDVLGRQLDKLNARIASHRGLLETENTYRQQPIFCLFGGASAVGKTFLIKNFASAALVMSGLCSYDQCAQNMWQKGEDRFFNGYCGQLVYIMDDVFQKKAVKGSDECEGMTIIRAVNSWPFPLPFADVESKGRFFFSSKLMVGTTNQSNIASDLDTILAQPQAVLRRVTHGYWLEVAPDFQCILPNGQVALDYQKWEDVRDARIKELRERGTFTSDEVLACVPWEAWNLKRCGFDGSDLYADGETVFGLVKKVAKGLKDGAARHGDSVKQLNSWLSMFSEAEPIVPQSGVVDRYACCDDDSVVDGSSVDSEGLELFPAYCEKLAELDVNGEPTGEFATATSETGRSFWQQEAAPEPAWKVALNQMIDKELNWRARLYAQVRFGVLGLFAKRHCFDVHGVRKAAALTLASVVFTAFAALKVLRVVRRVVVGAVGALMQFIFGENEDAIDEQSVHQVPKVYPKKKGEEVKPPSAVAQLGNPPKNVLSDIIYRNTWKLIGDGQPIGQVLFLSGTIGVMPFHFRDAIKRMNLVEMISCGAASLRVTFTGAVFEKFRHEDFDSADLTFTDFKPVYAKAHRDITGYCVTDRMVMNELVGSNDLAVRLDAARLTDIGAAHVCERVQMISRGLRYDARIAMGMRDVLGVWAYTMPTEAGDCGAPLTFAEPRYFGGHALLGIHIAGRTRSPGNGGQREGWSACLTKELVAAVLQRFQVIKDTFIESMSSRGIVVDEADADIVAECGLAKGSMVPIGTVPQDCAVSQSVRTKIKRTGFEGFGPCPVAPAILSPVVRDGLVVEPMHVAMANYQGPLHNSSVPNKHAIMGLAMKQHTKETVHSTRRVLSFEEAVKGVPELKLKSINRSSSAGYPFNLLYARGKRDIFGDGDEFDLETGAAKLVKRSVEGIVSAAKRSERKAHVFVDFLKDETRPLAKIDAVATRAISGAPLDYSIAVRQYFGAFMSSIHLNHTKIGMAPGINYYTEWDMLAERLVAPGGRVFAGDFKAFDASEQPDVHDLCLDYINNWYRMGGASDEDCLVRTVLFEDLVHSRHLTGNGCVRDALVQWNKSLPSGHPLTTIVNSMYSLYALTACYVEATGDLAHMWDRVYLCTYGDDNVAGVSDSVSEVFNQVTVAEMMKRKFNMVYTSDKKDAALLPYETIDDITFLKRGFVRAECEGGWSAPLAMDSILYRTYFYKNERTFARDLSQNFNDVLMELSLHPEQCWNDKFVAVVDYCSRNGIELDITSRAQARELCFARNDVWF